MLAREYCDLCRPKRKLKPIILSHPMLPGLKEVSFRTERTFRIDSGCRLKRASLYERVSVFNGISVLARHSLLLRGFRTSEYCEVDETYFRTDSVPLKTVSVVQTT